MTDLPHLFDRDYSEVFLSSKFSSFLYSTPYFDLGNAAGSAAFRETTNAIQEYLSTNSFPIRRSAEDMPSKDANSADYVFHTVSGITILGNVSRDSKGRGRVSLRALCRSENSSALDELLQGLKETTRQSYIL